jgi:hypothetical protein
MKARKHLFISHHFADDPAVDSLTKLMNKAGWDVRNSSIRMKEANAKRLAEGEIADSTLRRALRMKISWSQAVVVIIGKETHNRPWVDFEINQAHKLGKAIVGVYARGNTDAQVPSSLENYATSIVAWNTDSIRDALECPIGRFEAPDGTARAETSSMERRSC